MKAVDTNVLIRYLVQDDPAQSRKAAAYVEGAASADDQIMLSNIVLCETVWVLESAYGYAKNEIEGVIENLLQTSTFQFEMKDVVSAAFEDYCGGNIDFADCLIGPTHSYLGCEPTVTFDMALRKLSTFQIL